MRLIAVLAMCATQASGATVQPDPVEVPLDPVPARCVALPSALWFCPDLITGRSTYAAIGDPDMFLGNGKGAHLVAVVSRSQRLGHSIPWRLDDTSWQWTPQAVPLLYGSTGGCDCAETTQPQDPSPVPLPAGVWMLLAGLAVLAAASRRYRRPIRKPCPF